MNTCPSSEEFPVVSIKHMDVKLLLAEKSAHIFKHCVAFKQGGRNAERLVVVIEEARDQPEQLVIALGARN